ncbi:hypothetical protein [Prevotella melaninogenica]|nr:hypothetical protein [Prevotella melaninogenica]
MFSDREYITRDLVLRTIGAKYPHDTCLASAPHVRSINTSIEKSKDKA